MTQHDTSSIAHIIMFLKYSHHARLHSCFPGHFLLCMNNLCVPKLEWWFKTMWEFLLFILKQWAYGLKMLWLRRYTTTYSGLKTFNVELLNEQKIYCTSEISLRVFATRHFMVPHSFLQLKHSTWKYEMYQSDFNYIF